jgi:hypothetical protein
MSCLPRISAGRGQHSVWHSTNKPGVRCDPNRHLAAESCPSVHPARLKRLRPGACYTRLCALSSRQTVFMMPATTSCLEPQTTSRQSEAGVRRVHQAATHKYANPAMLPHSAGSEPLSLLLVTSLQQQAPGSHIAAKCTQLAIPACAWQGGRHSGGVWPAGIGTLPGGATGKC